MSDENAAAESEKTKTVSFESVFMGNAARAISQGETHIKQDGKLTVDCSRFNDDCDSVTVCALIEWARLAKQKNCQLHFQNIGARLTKFLRLYQLGGYFLPPSDKKFASN